MFKRSEVVSKGLGRVQRECAKSDAFAFHSTSYRCTSIAHRRTISRKSARVRSTSIDQGNAPECAKAMLRGWIRTKVDHRKMVGNHVFAFIFSIIPRIINIDRRKPVGRLMAISDHGEDDGLIRKGATFRLHSVIRVHRLYT